jgi:multidrug efflux pump subunit AcrA (membrane-fusion protein)
LLKKEKGQWSIYVCGGDGLKQASALVQTGMSSATADRLAKKVQLAEAKLSADQLKKLSMFEGVVKVDQGQHGAHGAHDAHASHPKH